MPDVRDCILCQQKIDLDEDGVTILATKGGSRGRTTILDASGRPHIMVKPKRNLKAVEPEEKER